MILYLYLSVFVFHDKHQRCKCEKRQQGNLLTHLHIELVELTRCRTAHALPGRAAAVREVVRVSRLWATEGGLDFIGEDVGLGHPTPLPTVAGKDTVKAEQGGEEQMPTEVLADYHPDQGANCYRLLQTPMF